MGCEPIAHDAGYTLTLDGLIGHDVSESSGGNRPHYVSPSPFTCVTCLTLYHSRVLERYNVALLSIKENPPFGGFL